MHAANNITVNSRLHGVASLCRNARTTATKPIQTWQAQGHYAPLYNRP